MEDAITRREHEEFAKRVDEENKRQNARIGSLEETVRQISDLTATVKELAINMKNMLTEQEKQGERLSKIEGKDGEMWRTAVTHILVAIIGAVIAYFFTKIGMTP